MMTKMKLSVARSGQPRMMTRMMRYFLVDAYVHSYRGTVGVYSDVFPLASVLGRRRNQEAEN